MSAAVRVVFFDASALLKIYIDEPGSELVRVVYAREPTKITSPFCFYETLSRLKAKWQHGHLDKKSYIEKSLQLTVWFESSLSKKGEVQFESGESLRQAIDIVNRYSIDLSDAFQIVTVKFGYFSNMRGDSQTLLVTADNTLASAARQERLKVWNCLQEGEPE